MSNDWQPIETAPKDGSLILIYAKRGQAIGFWDDCWKIDLEFVEWEGAAWGTIYNPTHWMPLPEPPVLS